MNFKAQILLIVLIAMSNIAMAQNSGTFNFSTNPSAPSDYNWLPAGALTNTFLSVDNTDLDISMTLDGATGTLTNFPGSLAASPSIGSATTGGSGEALTVATYGFGTDGITFTITFSQPLASADFKLFHINGSSYSGDLCTISAQNVLGDKIYPTLTASSNPSYQINYPSIGQVDAHSSSTAGDRDEVGIEFVDPSGITSITIVWSNCTTCGANFHGLGLINNLNFTLMNALPVELTYFSADLAADNSGILNWATASETNNRGFEIEQALPSSDVPVFEKIGFLEGAGTTVQAKNYSYSTQQLIPGTHYFRIKQIDFDGTYTYSNIQALTIRAKEEFITLYPNPTQGKTKIELGEQIEGDIHLELFNQTGQLMLAKVYNNQQLIELDVNFLPAAYYTIRLNTIRGTELFKLLKQ
ncbi:T9SS type A sorting domain-containing protein [Aureispira anguillae]|uniref:T9SS type A sorting domain-containing protein n=1 Tax=Aureispira anguillae TaxID=2864201 RepID=A0A915VKA6_9BACT|nr:T9SS type A sorting domain-containing protein [Aureispira anguillae]BDS09606.1 T9SS type A sorting domain-containing protein [Aureispira anguillae]